jgi:hypothetical protein
MTCGVRTWKCCSPEEWFKHIAETSSASSRTQITPHLAELVSCCWQPSASLYSSIDPVPTTAWSDRYSLLPETRVHQQPGV